MFTVSGLYIYPIKSLSGIAVDAATVTCRGLQHDRRLMLVDEYSRFLTQRTLPQLALLQPVAADHGLYIHHKNNILSPLFIPQQPAGNETVSVTVWDDTCEAKLYDQGVNHWFSHALGLTCRLVYMPDTTNREVDKQYALDNEITSFSDGYPILIIGQPSLDDLNGRLQEVVPMNRFRPNIVFTGGAPFSEDHMQTFTINGIDFSCVKPCARCVMTTINQETISKSKEPLKTLATYRMKNNNILFGQNLLHTGDGIIHAGDVIHVKNWQAPAI